MKLQKLICLATVAVLAFSVVGCRKGLQKTTPLPGWGQTGAPGQDENVRPIGNAPPTKTDQLPSGPVAMSDKIQNWVPSAEQPFKSDTVYFKFDKSTIDPGETAKIDRVVSQMKQKYAGKGLRIEGHADERGTEEYNRSLGERRAQSIREYLVRSGIDFQMVDTVSFGEDRPEVPGHTEAAWSKNRRGVFILVEPPK